MPVTHLFGQTFVISPRHIVPGSPDPQDQERSIPAEQRCELEGEHVDGNERIGGATIREVSFTELSSYFSTLSQKSQYMILRRNPPERANTRAGPNRSRDPSHEVLIKHPTWRVLYFAISTTCPYASPRTRSYAWMYTCIYLCINLYVSIFRPSNRTGFPLARYDLLLWLSM